MKKRTVCFGWTKKFQRGMAVAHDAARNGHMDVAARITAKVKVSHRKRVMALQGGAE